MTNLFLLIFLNCSDNSKNEQKYPTANMFCFTPILKKISKKISTETTIPTIVSIIIDIFSPLFIVNYDNIIFTIKTTSSTLISPSAFKSALNKISSEIGSICNIRLTVATTSSTLISPSSLISPAPISVNPTSHEKADVPHVLITSIQYSYNTSSSGI